MNGKIIKLDIANYYKCNNIWDMSKKKELAEKFYNELKNGNRITFIYIKEDEYVEITPKAIRLRKILLSEVDRKRASKE